MSKLSGWAGRSIRSFSTLKFYCVFYSICKGPSLFCFVLIVPEMLGFPFHLNSVMSMGKAWWVSFPREESIVAWSSLLQESDVLLQCWAWVTFTCLLSIPFMSFIIWGGGTTSPWVSFHVLWSGWPCTSHPHLPGLTSWNILHPQATVFGSRMRI